MSHFIELSCITNILSEVIKRWYEILFLIIEKYEIKWKNVYNQDESGFAIEMKRRLYIIIDSDIKIKYQV